MKRSLSLLAALLLAVACLQPARAADGASRERVLADLHDLTSPLTTERLRALQSLSMLANPAIVEELKVVDKTKAIAIDATENFMIRSQALETLVGLQHNNINIPGLMDMLIELLQPVKSGKPQKPLPLRLTAQRLMMVAVNNAPPTAGPNPLLEQALSTLKNLLSPNVKRDLPASMIAGVYECLGSFSTQKEARDLLMEGLRETSPEVLEAVVRALRNSIALTESTDKRLAEMLAERFMRSNTDKDRAIRVNLLQCLEAIISNTNRVIPRPSSSQMYVPNNALMEVVQNMLKTGNDDEVTTSVHFLMRMSSQDPKIATLLLSVAAPDPAHPLNYQTLSIINMALVDVLISMGRQKSASDTAASINTRFGKEAGDITNHMIALLNPANAEKIPLDLRSNMAMGLGCIPTAFDRAIAVQTLIALLEVEAKAEKPSKVMIHDVEKSLTYLTGVKPFVIIKFVPKETNPQTPNPGVGANLTVEKVEIPDIDRWKKWFEDNSAKLAPGKIPYE